MNKKVYLIIIYALTIAVIVIATGVKFSNWFHINTIFSTKIVAGDKTKTEFNVDPFTAIEGDLTVSGIKVVVDNFDQVVFEGTEQLVPTVEVKNGILVLKQKSKVKVIGNSEGKITIHTTTKDFDHFDVEVDVGSCELEGLSFKEFDVETNVGSVDLEDVTVEGDTKIVTNVGDVKIVDCNLNSTKISTDVGDVNISNTFTADNTFDLNTDVGDITCFGAKSNERHHYSSAGNDVKVDISTDVGEIRIR